MKKDFAFKMLSASVLAQPLTLPIGVVLSLSTHPWFVGNNDPTVNSIKSTAGAIIVLAPIASSLVASYYIIKQ
jgi:hypothetical protein